VTGAARTPGPRPRSPPAPRGTVVRLPGVPRAARRFRASARGIVSSVRRASMSRQKAGLVCNMMSSQS
jgi:hypothetical protein